MGRLVVEALGSAATGPGQGIAAAGNRDPVPIVVLITDGDGAPVSDLDSSNFTIEVKWADQGERPKVLIATIAIGEHGDYLLAVAPDVDDQGNPLTWTAGRYIFLLTITSRNVASRDDQGRTLCDVFVH